MITLRGITWDHSRALPPLVATAQRFEELHPGTSIRWEKRSLQEFGHSSLASLAERFDLLIVDHPMMGDAEAAGILVNLLPLLSAVELKEIEADSLGASFSSYLYHGKLYALPVDAAAPAASSRPDLLDRCCVGEPHTWNDVVHLADRGLVRMPGFPADLFLNFLGLSVSLGATVPDDTQHLVARGIGVRALESLRELATRMPSEIYGLNPISLYERMSSSNDIAYCPFAYTYSNYCRDGFAAHPIRFSNPVSLGDGKPIRTILGGTGLAISHACTEVSLALEYSLLTVGRDWQRTIYSLCCGQPARKSAWLDPNLNKIADGFFSRTMVSVEAAYVRPRYCGYVRLQEQAGEPIQDFCRGQISANQALDRVDHLYMESLVSRRSGR